MADSRPESQSGAKAHGTARLRRSIVLIGAAGLAAIACSSAYDTWRSYRQVLADNDRELANVAKALAEHLEGSLRSVDVLLRSTADWYATLAPDATRESIDVALANRAAELPQVGLLNITDAQGIRRYRSHATAAVEFSVADRSYFLVHRDDPQSRLFVSEPILTRSDGRHAFVLSRRLQDARGKFAGVVAAIVDLDEYQQFYRAINLGTRSAISLYRNDWTLVLRLPDVPGTLGKRFPPAVLQPGVPGATSAREVVSPIDGTRRFALATPVTGFPLIVAVARDSSAVLEPWREEAIHVTARTLLILLLGTLAIIALVRQFRRIDLGERALRVSEERYALALEGANEGHFDWRHPDGQAFLSPKMLSLHGRSAYDPAATRERWMAGLDLHPDDSARIEAAIQDHLAGKTDRYEVEYRVRLPDGAWRWLQARGRNILAADGDERRLVGSVIDITARKNAEAEKERLGSQLRQAQKLEAMGTLAGGIAHDFNNILGAILGYGELAQKNAPAGGPMRRYLDNVMHAGNRARALVERILAFSRSGVGERNLVNVQGVIEETLELLSASLAPGVRLEQRLLAGNAAVIADATQLHQVAMNLCTNAMQAMAQGGVLKVVLERVDVTEGRLLAHGRLDPGRYVRLCVSDTGSGIPPHVLDRMFDPFFTTKGVGEGTGLGLSLVHGIVADLGGGIEVHTAVGRGTSFTVWLPMAGEAGTDSTEVATLLPQGRGETVLVVDDETALVALAEEILAGLGYEPVGFSSSVAALQAFRRAPERFDVVLSDESMPEMVGTTLAREIRALRPDVPVVLMSGFSDAQLQERARAAGVRDVLRKPLQRRDLAESLGRIVRSS